MSSLKLSVGLRIPQAVRACLSYREGRVLLPAAYQPAQAFLARNPQTPNPSIEGTASGLRPPAAPHVTR
jgi:hypothetical protein